MKPKRILRMSIDTAMVILLPLLMAYALIGEATHEWIGIAMFLLFISHHILNWDWFKNLFKGRYTPAWIFGTVINFLLLIVMFLLPVSGIMMSRHVFRSLNFGGMFFARLTHLLASYWGFVLMSVHIGQHWNIMLGHIKKLMKKSKWLSYAARMLCVGISAYGVYAFITRQLGDYMLLKTQFVFFDFDESVILFMLDYAAMMVLFAALGYYLSKLFAKNGTNQTKKSSVL